MDSNSIIVNGKIDEIFPGGRVTVILENNVTIPATFSGKMKRMHSKTLRGDNVVVSISPYDMTRGVIIEIKK
ncbi:MAG: translation initiation factor IF-1 [Mycoplasmataceae bacterium]|jgi:translation initiation factor IF-1|nr:translation initiation factor IF-1 [Mycoplasmataceae bacterium]